MFTVTFSAATIFVLGICTGIVISVVGLVVAAIISNKKTNKEK